MRAPEYLVTLNLYEQWARSYPPIAHNPLMRAEQSAMLALCPDVVAARALDLACGTGRYAALLVAAGAADVIALDFSSAMLQQVSGAGRVRGNMSQLPFGSGVFDIVVSGLAAGHALDLDQWMAEVARVLRPGGVLLYSDFHPEATRAGHARSFKDDVDHTHTLPHHCYEVSAQREAAERAHLVVDATREVRAGFELCESFPRSDLFYSRFRGVAFVLVVRARKSVSCT